MSRMIGFLSGLFCIGLLPPVLAEEPRGLVIETVGEGALQEAGLAPGDILISWRQPILVSDPGAVQSGDLDSPSEWAWLELERSPRGPIVLNGIRNGAPWTWQVAPERWNAQVLPVLGVNEPVISGPRTEVLLQIGFAKQLQASGDLDAAAAAYQEALQTSRLEWGDCLVTAYILHKLGNLEYQRARLKEAQIYFSRALEIREKLAPGSLAVATSFNNLGILAYRRGEFAFALDHHQSALKIRQELDPNGLDIADSFLNLGAVASAMNNFEEATEYYRQSLNLSERLRPGSLLVADALNNLGNVFWATGDLISAEILHQNALAIRRTLAPNSLDYADSLNNLGLLAEARRDIVEARDYYLRCLDLHNRLIPDSLQASDVLSNLGILAVYQGDFATALEYHERSLRIRQRDAPGSLDESASLNNLGVLHQDQGQLSAAYDYFVRAHEIKKKIIPGTLDFAISLGNLGDVAFARGDLEVAKKHFIEAIRIQKEVAPYTVDLARDVADYGRIFVATGEDAVALAIFEESLAIVEKIAPKSEEAAIILHEIGALETRLSDKEAAAGYFARAAAALEGQMERLGGSDAVRGNFRARHHSIYLSAIASLLDLHRSEEAFKVLETYRARSFLDLLAERDLKVPSELGGRISQERRRLATRYDEILSEMAGKPGLDPALQLEMEAIVRQRETLLESIRRESPNTHQIAYTQPKGAQDVAKALNPGTLLLSYSVGPKGIDLFVLSRDFPLRVYSIRLSEDDLRAKVREFTAAILRTGSHRPEFQLQATRLGQALFEQLLQPATAEIETAERLLFVPDGPLHSLPFGALVLPAPSSSDAGPRFLAELKPIHFALSGTAYLEIRKELAGQAKVAPLVAVFADPSFPAPEAGQDEIPAGSADPQLRAALDARAKSWSPLGETREEALGIARLNKNTEIYLGAGATEEKVKSLDRTVNVVHFATHAFLDDLLPLNSGLLLSIPPGTSADRENGLFQAWEIFEEFRLDADLVVLSACETGLGKEVGGEGLIGLTRAFQFAGAKTVLASLWQVPDQATSELMVRFYRHLRDGLPKDDALRAAQIDLIRQPVTFTNEEGESIAQDFSAPFHWAAFQLYGDWQ